MPLHQRGWSCLGDFTIITRRVNWMLRVNNVDRLYLAGEWFNASLSLIKTPELFNSVSRVCVFQVFYGFLRMSHWCWLILRNIMMLIPWYVFHINHDWSPNSSTVIIEVERIVHVPHHFNAFLTYIVCIYFSHVLWRWFALIEQRSCYYL